MTFSQLIIKEKKDLEIKRNKIVPYIRKNKPILIQALSFNIEKERVAELLTLSALSEKVIELDDKITPEDISKVLGELK